MVEKKFKQEVRLVSRSRKRRFYDKVEVKFKIIFAQKGYMSKGKIIN